MIYRNENNPLLSPHNIRASNGHFEVVGTLNPGVCEYNGKTVLLVRVAERVRDVGDEYVRIPCFENSKMVIKEFLKNDSRCDFSDSRLILSGQDRYLTSMSYLLPAISSDGVNFELMYDSAIFADSSEESYGIEDARITQIEDTYYVTYSAASKLGVCVSLITTKDFITYTRNGVILPPDNKDAAFFPKKVNGKYYMIHRPSISEFGKPEIWIAESEDLLHWGNHKHVMSVRPNMWDSVRIGSSSVPIRIKEGWLMIYHGANKDDRYCLGACLLDGDEPWRVLGRTEAPFMEPTDLHERTGFFGNVVFSCGCVRADNMLKIYYGAADQYVCSAEIAISDIVRLVKKID